MAELIINNWQQGIGTSPYTGFAQMTNVDIYSEVGSVKISNKLKTDSNSTSVVDGLIKWAAQDPQQGDIYAVDDNGKVYKRDEGTGLWSVIAGHGTSSAHGEGLAIWKDYLFVARSTTIDVYGPLSGGASWTNNWQTLESSSGTLLHPMMPAQDDILYVGNAQYVDTLEEVFATTFDPTNNTTYTYNSQDLELRSDYRVTCLEEQGSQIVIGTLIGINGIFNVADVFIWDGTSDSFSLNGTVHLVENGVRMMKNVNNTIFSIAGDGVPRIFNFVTSQSQEAKRFNNIEVGFTERTSLNPGACEYKEGEVLFGIGASFTGVAPVGVYALRNGAYVLRYLISTLNDGTAGSVRIGIVKTLNSREILVSWRDSNNSPLYGVDILTENFYTNYTAYVESPIYQVATDDDPITFEKVQVRMGKALKAGDKVKIQARFDLADTWVDVAEFDTVAEPLWIGKPVVDLKVSNVGYFKNFQAKILLDVDATEDISPELMSVTFN